MPGQDHYVFAPGIVVRLRLIFLTIAVVLLMAMATGFLQIGRLDRSVKQLANTSVPIFVNAEETERRLKNLLLLLQRVESLDRQAELKSVSQEVHEQLLVLQNATDQSRASGPSADLQAALREIEQVTSAILKTKEAMLRHEQILAFQIHTLERTRETAWVLLENLSYDAAISADLKTVSGSQQGNELPNLVEQRYRQNLAQANTITAMSLEIEAVIDIAKGLRNIQNLKELEQNENTLRFKIRGISTLIGRLPQSSERTKLAVEVLALRNLIFGEAGLFNEVTQLQSDRAALEANKLKQFGPIEAISKLSSELTNTAKENIEDAGQNLSATMDRMLFTLALTTLLSLLVICAAAFFILERQINRRMSKLTKAVLAIADGQTKYDVDVTGPDELGKMASALNVFKLNAEELHRSNAELEKFAYVAAHDLRSPLRAVQDLTEWTLEDTDTVFSDDGRENMALIQRRIGRLNQLLKDLLQYSRVGKEANDLTDVSLKNTVGEIADLLDSDDNFKITFSGPTDTIRTYVTPLRQILRNLINNSIKHHDRSQGSIAVEAYISSGRFHCSVQDDGPGIDPQHHERIFGLFQTLRPRDEVEGSGLGLAIIRKLLAQYRGSIKVISDPAQGRGTKFIFDMPEKSGDAIIDRRAA